MAIAKMKGRLVHSTTFFNFFRDRFYSFFSSFGTFLICGNEVDQEPCQIREINREFGTDGELGKYS